MIGDAAGAVAQVLSRPSRVVLYKTLAFTLLLVVALWAVAERAVVVLVHPSRAWLATSVHLVAGLGLVVGAAFLVTPIAFAVASFFFDDIAEQAEAAIGIRGRTMPIGPALWLGAKFGIVSLVVNIGALALLLVPGVNLVAFFGANAYLLGRGFFELAALRHLPIEEVRALRRTHSARIFLAGCLPAALSLVPLLNLLTPIYASALMVRVAAPLVRTRLPAPTAP